MALEVYRKKRKFGVTSEPRGRMGRGGGDQFVIQKHAASRLHYDLRLELDGVMKSWAVAKGPSLDSSARRLAVQVEDHPIEYNSFEGTIPQGQYGGGTVMIWDKGRWIPDGDPHEGYAKGNLTFDLEGQKLHGRWHLVRMHRRSKDRHDNWLLIKGRDEYARTARDPDILEELPLSATTGRTMDEIAAGKGRKRVWHSNRDSDDAPDRPQTQRAFKEQLKALGANAAKRKASTKSKAMDKAKAGEPPAVSRATTNRVRGSARPGQNAGARTDLSNSRRRAKPAEVPIHRVASAPVTAARHNSRSKLPEFVRPSLARLQSTAPSGGEWLHEIKFDGYRIQARLESGKVTLLTRNRQDWTHRFAPVADAVARLPAESALLDGELVVENEQGISSFSLLQTALKDGRRDRFVYYVFDLLYLDGRNLMEYGLAARKDALKILLNSAGKDGPIRYAEHFEVEGATMLDHACALHLEGIVSKRRDAPYASGRTDNFIKSKCHDAQEFVVAGFSLSAAEPNAVGALTVAAHENGELRYAGRVGTGFTRKTARDLWERLRALKVARAPIAIPKDERRKDVIWVKPQLVIETEYRGVTHGNLLRQASYKGLREDKPAGEVVRETPLAPAGTDKRTTVQAAASVTPAAVRPKAERAANLARAGGRRVTAVASIELTHPDRVYWVDVGVTKEDLAEYYVKVWEWIAPHIVGRPLSLVRCPGGTAGQCFFQKHIPDSIKQSPLRHKVNAKEHDVIAVEKVDDVVTLVQSGALEIHVRGSRLEALETCDRIVFDLDPGEGVSWDAIVAAARETRDRLAELKLKSFCKLSGGKGVHVMLPLDGVDWDAAKAFSQHIAAAMESDSPARYVAKMTKAIRNGKIFIDYFRNSREATSVAAYSTRARPGAAVSMPLSWEQLSGSKAANEFTVLNLKKRFKRDPWAEIGKVRQNLPQIAKRRRG